MMQHEIEKINQRIERLETRFRRKQNLRNQSYVGSNFSILSNEDTQKWIKKHQRNVSFNENASLLGESRPNIPHSFNKMDDYQITDKYVLKKPFPRYQLYTKNWKINTHKLVSRKDSMSSWDKLLSYKKTLRQVSSVTNLNPPSNKAFKKIHSSDVPDMQNN